MIISPDNTLLWAVPMSKKVNRVNIEPEILHGNWSPTGSIMKYNSFVSPSCKTDITTCNNTF